MRNRAAARRGKQRLFGLDLDQKKRKVKDEVDDAPSSSAASSSSGVAGIKPDDGLAWDLGNDKLLRVKTFKGKTYVDIREFCE